MAVQSNTITKIDTYKDDCHIITWAALADGNSGDPVEMPGSSDRSVHVKGTFGAGGTVVLEGSNDGVTYVTLTDPQGNALSKTAEAIEMIEELTRYVRPRVTAGDGTTAIDVYLLVKRVN